MGTRWNRDVITVLGLEDAKPVATPNVKRTPTTEWLVELENDRRTVYRTAVVNLFYMCQERADIMYSVKETARKIICPTESDDMHVKRVVTCLKGAPSAKSLIEIVTPQGLRTCTQTETGQVNQRHAKVQVAELCSGETQLSPHGHEHSKR